MNIRAILAGLYSALLLAFAVTAGAIAQTPPLLDLGSFAQSSVDIGTGRTSAALRCLDRRYARTTDTGTDVCARPACQSRDAVYGA